MRRKKYSIVLVALFAGIFLSFATGTKSISPAYSSNDSSSQAEEVINSSKDSNFGYYKLSKRCKSQKLGRWIDMMKNERQNIIIFGDKYIIVKERYGLGSDMLDYLKTSGQWKVYGPHVESTGKFYYYVDDEMNMQMVLVYDDGKTRDTFTFPMIKE